MLSRLGLVALAGALAGCSVFGGEEEEQFAQVCPRVVVLKDTAKAVQFRGGGGQDITDIRFQADIADARWTCDYDDGTVNVSMQVSVLAERGPAAPDAKEARFEYYVAVADRDDRILNKGIFDVTLPFDNGRLRSASLDEVALSIPLKPGESGADRLVYLGFQLDRAQLEYVRDQR